MAMSIAWCRDGAFSDGIAAEYDSTEIAWQRIGYEKDMHERQTRTLREEKKLTSLKDWT